jgi:hypothetical protein
VLLRLRSATGSVSEDAGQLLAFGARAARTGLPLGPVTDEQVDQAAQDSSTDPPFAQTAGIDMRTRVLAAIAQRLGQPRFRSRLMTAYDGCCAISGCDLPEALEAAHVLAYRGPHTHHVTNGLLLRADLHTLFDRGLIGVDPSRWAVRIHTKLHASSYRGLDGAKFRLPVDTAMHPDKEALMRHLAAAGI